jgi:hypothetical protein
VHGIIFAEFKKFVVVTADTETWVKLQAAAGLEHRRYLASETYPDQELADLVQAASRLFNKSATLMLETFGEFIVPDLLGIYHAFIKSEWTALDVIEKAESTIHKTVRRKDPTATPPVLQVNRLSQDEVQIIYNSERKLCSVAKGIIRGVGKHYGEALRIEERECMLRGGKACTLLVSIK